VNAPDEKSALRFLGQGMHTVMDEMSPSHTGSQPWWGVPWPFGDSFTEGWIEMASHAANDYFVPVPCLSRKVTAFEL